MTTQVKKKPGRKKRVISQAKAVSQEILNDEVTHDLSEPEETETSQLPRRRKKRGSVDNYIGKLHAPEERLDKENYAYRWVNDTPGNIKNMYNEDWDIVEDADIETEAKGTKVTRFVGNTGKTEGGFAVLMKKDIRLHEADLATRLAEINAVEEQIKRTGMPISSETPEDKLYTPKKDGGYKELNR